MTSALNRLNAYGRDERGNMGILAAATITVALGIIGASVDYRIAANEKSRAQQVADAVALQAAVFVRTHNRVPHSGDTGAITEGTHTAADLGFKFSSAVRGGNEGVTIDVAYDRIKREADVEVKGLTETSFSKVMGKDRMAFSSKTKVSFEAIDVKDAASIVMILDNSGSMRWDTDKAVKDDNGNWTHPANHKSRMNVLKNSTKTFMRQLDWLVGNQSDDKDKLVRTGMVAFDNKATQHEKTMQWRLLSNSDIDAMAPGGGTYPDRAINMANGWMSGEDAIHKNMNGKDPLKYAIYITDGENDQENPKWEAKSGTEQWRRQVERWEYRRNCSSCGWYYARYTKYHQYKNQKNSPGSHGAEWTSHGRWRKGSDGQWYATRKYNYKTTGWEEGKWTRPTDDKTLEACGKLKSQGVKVYSIGFGLESGHYMKNEGNSTKYISPETTNFAYNMLRACASDPDSFIIAKDAVALEEAFSTIGHDIVDEVIRLKS